MNGARSVTDRRERAERSRRCAPRSKTYPFPKGVPGGDGERKFMPGPGTERFLRFYTDRVGRPKLTIKGPSRHTNPSLENGVSGRLDGLSLGSEPVFLHSPTCS